MNDKKMTLYVDSQFISPYAMSVYVTLKEKGIPFDIEKVDLKATENHSPGYAERSLTCRVPTLTQGDFHLSESSAISEYLEEIFPSPGHEPVYPKDLQDRAKARQIQAWLRSDLAPIREERSTEVVFFSKQEEPLSETAQTSVVKLFAAVDSLLVHNTPNLFGDWCIADTDLAVMLNRLIKNGDSVPEKLSNYAHHQWQRASVQQWVKLACPGTQTDR